MLSEDEIRADYVSMVKRLMKGEGGSWDAGYTAALKNVLCLDDDDWKKLVAEDLKEKQEEQ